MTDSTIEDSPDAWPKGWPPIDGLASMAKDFVRCDSGVEYVVDHAIDRALERPPRHSGNVRGWFRRTMRNASIDWFRSQSARTRAVQTELEELRRPLASVSEFDRAAIRETVSDIESELQALPAREREVLRLSYWESLSNPEIATRLGVSVSSVERSKRSALDTIRNRVDTDGGEVDPDRIWASRFGALAVWSGVQAGQFKAASTAVGAGGAAGAKGLAAGGLSAAGVSSVSGWIGLFVLALLGSAGWVGASLLQSSGDDGAGRGSRGVGRVARAAVAGSGDLEAPDLVTPSSAVQAQFLSLDSEGQTSNGATGESAEATQVVRPRRLKVTLTGEDHHVTGLLPSLSAVGPDGKSIRFGVDQTDFEESPKGTYVVQIPDQAATSWRVYLSQPENFMSVRIALEDGVAEPSREVPLRLVSRKLRVDVPEGKNYDRSEERIPWFDICHVTELDGGVRILSKPRQDGGTLSEGRFDRPFVGVLRFPAISPDAAELGWYRSGASWAEFERIEIIEDLAAD